MTSSGAAHRSSDEAVREAVGAASDRRRRREASRRLWRIGPAIAGGCLTVAAASRWAAWPAALPLALVALAVAGLATYSYLERRRHAVSDTIAAAIDAEGGFGGELRSASWFARRERSDEWADFHLDHAASRLTATDWARLYPPPPTRRARVATLGMLIAAIALVVAVPARTRVRASDVSAVAGPVVGGAVKSAPMMQLIPPDLRKRLEELLAAAERGTLSKEQQTKQAAELYNLFTAVNEDLDPEKLKELAKAMDPTQNGSAQQAAKKMTELAGRTLKAADTKGLPPELRKALEDLGMQISESADAEARSAGDEAAQSAPAGKDSAQAGATPSNAPPNLDQTSIEFSKDSEAGAGAGMMMMSQQPGPMGDPSSGFGGAGGGKSPNAGGKMPGFEQALRRETVEASADTAGANVISEVRRKTEHGQATVAFTQSAPGPSDRSRAAAPPAVPEGRRASVQSYFTRKQ